MSTTDRLFSPVTMGAIKLPNRILMAQPTRNRAHGDGNSQGDGTDLLQPACQCRFDRVRSTQVGAIGKGYIDTPGIHSDDHVRAWAKITDAVHAAGGRIFLQLWRGAGAADARASAFAKPVRR